jgi:hypothetical protein
MTAVLIPSLALMRPAAILFAVMLCASMLSCGGSKDTASTSGPSTVGAYRYAPKANFTSGRAASADDAITVPLPAGWAQTADKQHAADILIWLVRDDYAATLTITPLQMDPALYTAVRKDGLTAVAKVSMNLKQKRATDSTLVVHPVETFTLGTRQYAAYEYAPGQGRPPIRVVLFDSGAGMLECALFPAASTMSPAETRRLFELQQAVLAGMQVR